MLRIGALLFTFAFILRTFFIFAGGVSFHYDMARDAFTASQIWKEHNLKILGPPTSVTGLYHGVFYYYLIAPFYMLGKGSPIIVAIFLSLLNCLVIVPIMVLAKEMYKNKNWTILAGLLFSLSFEAAQYAPWISNPQPAVLTIALFFLSLFFWEKGKSWGLYFSVLFAALSSQFQFFLIYLFLLIPLFGMQFKIKTKPKQVVFSVLISALGLINFVIVMIRFNTFNNTFLSLLKIPTGDQIDFRSQFSQLLLNYFNRLAELFSYNFFPTNLLVGGILSLFILYQIRKEKILLFFLLSNIPIFIFGGHSNTYANIGLVVPAILAVVFALKKVWKTSKISVVIFISLSVISNIYYIVKYNPQGQVILVIQNDMNLKQELNVIDQTYKLAGGTPFSINTITLPFWINTTWAYLYGWYGKGKYGYVPSYYGRDQIGLLGEKSLQKVQKPLDKSFLIIEPLDGIPMQFVNDEISSEDSKTKIIKEMNFGSIKLQARSPKNGE